MTKPLPVDEQTRNAAVARALDKYLRGTPQPRGYAELARLIFGKPIRIKKAKKNHGR